MSQFFIQNNTGGGGGGNVQFLKGNTGAAVPPDGSGIINTIGDLITTTVAGTPGNNTTTVSTLFLPNKVLELVDDFIQTGDGPQGQLHWTTGGSTVSFIASLPGNPGLIQFQTNNDPATGLVLQDTNQSLNNLALGGGAIESHYVFNLNTLSAPANRYTCLVGFGDINVTTVPPTVPDSGIFFFYSDNVNGGKWEAICKNATIATTVDTGVLATTGFINFGFQINAAATSVIFLINGSSVATISTNIPSSITPFILEFNVAGNLPGSIQDLFSFRQVLTVAR